MRFFCIPFKYFYLIKFYHSYCSTFNNFNKYKNSSRNYEDEFYSGYLLKSGINKLQFALQALL